jgi:class 3 adenylate cyclase
VVATVLFTDIVGSTERAAELGDRRWRELLNEHDRLVRERLSQYRGREVKTIGDGFLATFDGPARAIECASAIREEVRELGVELRAGLHTGECEPLGDDVGGMAVHIGARVCALAGAGEVLVSGTVKDLVVGSGIEFSDRGVQTLKGVPDAWRLFAVGSERAASVPLPDTRLAAMPEQLEDAELMDRVATRMLDVTSRRTPRAARLFSRLMRSGRRGH